MTIGMKKRGGWAVVVMSVPERRSMRRPQMKSPHATHGGPSYYARACARAALLRGAGRTPAVLVGLAHNLGIRRRSDRHLDLKLLVALDRGLLGAAAFLAPDEGKL